MSVTSRHDDDARLCVDEERGTSQHLHARADLASVLTHAHLPHVDDTKQFVLRGNMPLQKCEVELSVVYSAGFRVYGVSSLPAALVCERDCRSRMSSNHRNNPLWAAK